MEGFLAPHPPLLFSGYLWSSTAAQSLVFSPLGSSEVLPLRRAELLLKCETNMSLYKSPEML